MKYLLAFLLISFSVFGQSNLGVTYNTGTKVVSPPQLYLDTSYATADPTTAFGLATKRYVDKRVFQASNVAAAQALTNLVNNDIIQIAGRTTAGDGGGSTVYYSSSSTSTTNLGTIFTATGMGTGRLIWNGEGDLNVQMFSAVPTDMSPRAWSETSANVSAISTNDFSVWIQSDIPSYSIITNCPTGRFHGIGMIQNYTGGINDSGYAATSDVEILYNKTEFYVLFRGTDGGSASASSAKLSYPIAQLLPFSGSSTKNVVFTRTGTNVACYVNGTVLTGGTITNPSNFTNSVAGGNSIRLLAGSAANVTFSPWPARVYQGAIFRRVLSGADLINPGAAASPVAPVTIPYTGAFPSDSTASIQSAIDYVSSLGGGTVTLNGAYYLAGTVQMKPKVLLKGTGVGKQVFITPMNGSVQEVSTSRVFSGFDSTNQMFAFAGLNNSGTSPLYINAATDGFNSEVYSTWSWYSGINGLTIDQSFSLSGDAIQALYASLIQVEDVGFVGGNGYMVNAYFSGQIALKKLWGGSGRGVTLWSCSDSQMYDSDYGGTSGAGVSVLASPAVLINRNKVWNTSKSIGGAASADSSTDVVTTSSTVDLWQTGDMVTFEGTPPSPLTIMTPYWVSKTGAGTFKVALNRANAVAGTIIDLTTAGSFSVYPAPCANLWSWKNNQLYATANRMEESYENDAVIQGTSYSTVLGNGFYRSGLNNASHLFGGVYSLANTNVMFSDNRFGKRLPSDGSSYGLYGFNVSTNNSQITLLSSGFGQVTIPINIDTNQSLDEVGTGNYDNTFWGFGPPHLNATGIVAESDDSKTITAVGRGTFGPAIQFVRSLGSPSAPTVPTSGTSLGSLLYSGYTDATTISSGRARINGYAGETWSPTATGTYLGFEVTTNATTTSAEVLRIAPTLITASIPITGTALTMSGTMAVTGASTILGNTTIGAVSAALSTFDVVGNTITIGSDSGTNGVRTTTIAKAAQVTGPKYQTSDNVPVFIETLSDASNNRLTLGTANASGTNQTINSWALYLASTRTGSSVRQWLGTAYGTQIASSGTSASTPNSSALMDWVSTTQGLGVMNMTRAQFDAISSRKSGLFVFDTTNTKLATYDGTRSVNLSEELVPVTSSVIFGALTALTAATPTSGTITVTGAAVGDEVIVTPSALNSGSTHVDGVVTSANTVTLYAQPLVVQATIQTNSMKVTVRK